ncbi:hypothetical protein M2138_001074 [Dysgonomonadaceae bacterium PH5-43]|nr:hypothetical protein [Dysgonomonadaceae bacterium PH5-43]
MKVNIPQISLMLLLFFTFSCSHTSENYKKVQQELDLVTDSTITINISKSTIKECSISELIDSVRYVALENSDEALLGLIRDIKVTKELIYVFDLNEQLKCFDRQGNFIRDVCEKGGGPEEVGRLVDFDVDEDYVYVLDYTKNAIQIFDHNGNYVKKERLPFRAHKFKCLPDKSYLFQLAPFAINNDKNPYVVAYTNQQIEPITYFLEYIEGVSIGVDFENQRNSTFIYHSYGNGIYEKRDSSFFMKYYLDFDGKYFNSDKRMDGLNEAVDQGLYFTANAPFHNEKYLLQDFYAGLGRKAVLFIDLRNNKSVFIKNIIQDRDDLIDFSFGYTKGYDVENEEFFSICNYLDLSQIISDNKEDDIKRIREQMPPEVQPLLLQEDGEMNVNEILLFYKLKENIDFDKLSK